MGKPIRSVRLEKRSTRSLNTLSGSEGEIFYDNDANALRIYIDNAGASTTVADRQWVLDNAFSGSYNELTDKPTAFANLDFIGVAVGPTISEFSTDATFTDASDTALPTELAVKTYVESLTSNISSNIVDLNDVVVTNLAPNEVLQYNGSNWVNVDLASAQDTNTTYSVSAVDNPTGGAYIQLNGSDASTDFVELTAGTGVTITRTSASAIEIGAGTGSLSIDDLSDVNTSTTAPTTGQVLKWDGAQWVPANDATLGGAGLDADSLDGQDGSYYLDYTNFTNTPTIPSELLDLGINDGSNGQVLTTNGNGTFTFATVTHPSIPTDLTDLGISDGTNGQVLGTDGAGNFTFIDQTGIGGATYDQSLNTTDDVEFNSVSSATFTNTGVGAPTITSASTIALTAPDGVTINGTVTTDALTIGALDYPSTDGTSGQVLTTNGSGTLTFQDASGGISNVVEDTTPQLGGDLDANFKNITNVNTLEFDSAGSTITSSLNISEVNFTSRELTGTTVISNPKGWRIAPQNVDNAVKDLLIDAPGGTGISPRLLLSAYGTAVGTGEIWIQSRGTIDIESYGDISITASENGSTSIQGLTYPSTDGSNGQVLTTNGSGTLTFSGLLTLDGVIETADPITGATGTVTHDLVNNSVFLHTSIAANFTADFPISFNTNNRVQSAALILVQGSTAYMPTAVEVDGISQTVLWQGGSAPSGTANGTDVVSFTFIRTGFAWTVLGSATSYS
jgi:hypothetical protein